MISGATGTLGKAFARLCELRGIPYRLLSRQEMDITSVHPVMAALRELEPWALVNASGYVRVDEAEQHFEACDRVNARGPAILAAACQHLGIQLLTYSSDLVFDGKQSRPYVENDRPAPLCVYGSTKAEGEARALSLCPSALVVRTSSFFGPWDDANFVTLALRKVAAGLHVAAANHVVVTPTYVPDLVHASLDLLLDGEQGLWHLSNGTAVTWYDLARRAAELAHLDAALVDGYAMDSLGLAARRPSYSALGSERGQLLPSLDDALARYLQECEIEWAEQTA